MIHFAVVERLAGASLRNTFSRSKLEKIGVEKIGVRVHFHRSQDDPQILMLTLTPVFHLPINESDPAITSDFTVCQSNRSSLATDWIDAF